MIGAEQLIAHLIGDYVLQTDHMASEKSKSVWVALWHAMVYTLPFLFITQSFSTLVVITWTHAVIDHYKLARYVVWIKNQVSPARFRYPLHDALWHGYREDKPSWLAGWLFILADNAMHIVINAVAITYLG